MLVLSAGHEEDTVEKFQEIVGFIKVAAVVLVIAGGATLFELGHFIIL
jgi:hypothetical protein